MNKMMLAALAVAGAAVASVPAEAQMGWRTVGYKTVNGRDTDTINLRGHARYRQVRLCTINAPVRMRDFDVRFDNGQRYDVAVRQFMRAGTCTRNIDLPGNRRDIDAIRLRYEPLQRGMRRPLIRVQAR